jgi:hypothetical protein
VHKVNRVNKVGNHHSITLLVEGLVVETPHAYRYLQKAAGKTQMQQLHNLREDLII